MSLTEHFKQLPLYTQLENCLKTSKETVEVVLQQPHWTAADLPVLLSPAAASFIEQMAQLSSQLTQQRFGHTMQLFAPMYLSNECYNTCTYCGFSREHTYQRVTLSDKQIIQEAKTLQEKGIAHVLLLTGESPKKVGIDYITHAVELVRPYFSSIGIEVQPLQTAEYQQLITAGCDNLTLYQETYHPEAYQKYHLFGIKKNYTNRLDASERGAIAGMYKINLGILLGLYDWRYDGLALGTHLAYMMKHHWQTKYAVSFPRIKDMVGPFKVDYPVSDAQLVQLICAFRLCFPDTGITLSTREPAHLRDPLFQLGITTISAESNTSPGGYSVDIDAEKQFEISDNRSITEIASVLQSKGIEPVFKDWV